MVNLARVSQAKRVTSLTALQASYKFLNAWGNIISVQSLALLGENMFYMVVSYMERLHLQNKPAKICFFTDISRYVSPGTH